MNKSILEKKSPKKIMEALKTLHDQYDCTIINESYRGPMIKTPKFTNKQIAKITGLSTQTVNRWCKELYKLGYLTLNSKKRYFANDPVTYIFARRDLKPVKLTWGVTRSNCRYR